MTVLLFTSGDLLEMFEHYKRAFNAKFLWDGRGDAGELSLATHLLSL